MMLTAVENCSILHGRVFVMRGPNNKVLFVIRVLTYNIFLISQNISADLKRSKVKHKMHYVREDFLGPQIKYKIELLEETRVLMAL